MPCVDVISEVEEACLFAIDFTFDLFSGFLHIAQTGRAPEHWVENGHVILNALRAA